MAYDLVEAFKHLGNMNFIYADLNPKNFFVNMTEGKLCLIDYEGGAINDNPETFGKPGDWLAPEIQEQLRNGQSLITVDFNTDTWAVAIGVHFLLFPFHPLFFLKTVGRDEMNNYLHKYKYPLIDKKDNNFREPKAYDWYIERLNQLPSGIIKAFDETVNYGYKNPNRRLSYKQWHQAISSLMTKPIIKSFTSNSYTVLNGKSVELFWEVEDFESINIVGIGNVTGKNSISVSPTQSTIYKLTAENAFGKIEKEVTVKVLPLFKINEFRSQQQKIEYGKETQLIWDIENAKKVELHWLGNMKAVPNKEAITISPKEHTYYKLIITALDGFTTVEQKVQVQVFKKVEIKNFVSNFDFVIESVPIKLSWEIENASKVTLCSNIGTDIDVTGKNEIEVLPKGSTFFSLKVNNELFHLISPQLKVEVQKIPTFNPNVIPTLPAGQELIPSFNLDFKEISDVIFSESQISFQTAMKTKKRFSLLNSLQKILK